VDSKDEIAEKLKSNHIIPEQLKEIPEPTVYPELDYSNNEIFFVDYDMVQANIIMLAKDEKLDMNLMPEIRLFNEYYGGSMASIIFQEIRESRALAYSAFSSYSTPSKPEDSGYSFSFVATSTDKVKDATDALVELLNEMPYEEKQFNEAKSNMLKKIESERITKERVFWTYLSNLRKGVNHDYRKDVYEKVQNQNIDDLNNFFSKHIANKKHCYLVVGNKKVIDMNTLKKLGNVHELSLNDVFNY
jgi:predicted Zn-dependent peptidase